MRIMLYGNSYVTELVERTLMHWHEVVGHVPCNHTAFPGRMRSEVVEFPEHMDYDLALSVFYDRKVKLLDGAYNLHPGLLPRWGGCNILYHTIVEGATEQGVTFHRMTEDFDAGPIVTTATYPVRKGDCILSLYTRVCAIMPGVALAGLELAKRGLEAPAQKPTYYPRSLKMAKPKLYTQAREDITAWIRSQR